MSIDNSRKTLAKKNLKKSIYISTGMAVLVGTIGISVSIPVYLSTKEGINSSTSALSDFSSKMSELVAKLGIASDERFEKELDGGFIVVFHHGKTQILRSIHGEKTLIMNMNQDKSIGSAAMKTGAAAKAMLSAIESASQKIGEESSALEDVVSELAQEAEDESLQIEAAVTGLSITELKVRNALSDTSTAGAERALKELQTEQGISLDDINAAKKKAEEEIRKRKEAEVLARKRLDDLREAERKGAQELKRVQQEQERAKIVERTKLEKRRVDAQSRIEEAKKKVYRDWIIKNHPATVLSPQASLVWLSEKYNSLKEYDKTNFISSKAVSTAKWLGFYIRVHFGYIKRDGTLGKNSTLLEASLKKELLKKGLKPGKYSELTSFANDIVNINGGISNSKIIFTDIMNTRSHTKNTSSKLNVVEVKITKGQNTTRETLLIMTNQDSNINVEDMKVIKDNLKVVSISKMANFAKNNYSHPLYNTIVNKLSNGFGNPNTFKTITQNNLKMVTQLDNMCLKTKEITNDVEKTFANGKIDEIGNKIFFGTRDVIFDGNKLSKLIHDIYAKNTASGISATSSIYKTNKQDWLSILKTIFHDDMTTTLDMTTPINNATTNLSAYEALTNNDKTSLLNDVTFKMFTSKIPTIIINYNSLIKLSNRYITLLSKHRYDIWKGDNKLKEDANISMVKTINSVAGFTADQKIELEKSIDAKMSTVITNIEFGQLLSFFKGVISWLPASDAYSYIEDTLKHTQTVPQLARIQALKTWITTEITNINIKQILINRIKDTGNNVLNETLVNIQRNVAQQEMQKQINSLSSKEQTVTSSNFAGSGIFDSVAKLKYGIKIPTINHPWSSGFIFTYSYVASGDKLTITAQLQKSGTSKTIATEITVEPVDAMKSRLVSLEQTRINNYFSSHVGKTTTTESDGTAELTDSLISTLGISDMFKSAFSDRKSFIDWLKKFNNDVRDDSSYQKLTHAVKFTKGNIEYYFEAGSTFYVNWRGHDKRWGIYEAHIEGASGTASSTIDSISAKTGLSKPQGVNGLPIIYRYKYTYTISGGILTIKVSVALRTGSHVYIIGKTI